MKHSSHSRRILIVEDDQTLAALVARHLVESEFEVMSASHGHAALELVDSFRPDLIVLDVMLPGIDGLSLCRQLRRRDQTPIIMVTARGQESDRILGLEMGADDYLPKPFSLWELEARIKAVLRRSARTAAPEEQKTAKSYGRLIVDTSQRVVLVDSRRIELTRTEFDILAQLISEPGRVFSRDQLLDHVQGGDSDAFDRAVDTHISNLRRKIEDDPKSPSLIKTVWGVGYRFEPA